jgi:2-oxoglutarate ferredoxin oxidoreductase subunit gamma
MVYEVTFAGFGGQGIMTGGKLLALAGMAEGMEVCWIPSYGPEMRGGTAYCTVVLADRPIGSPIVNTPQCAVAMNRPSLDKFAPMVRPGGLLVINSSLIDVTSDRTDIRQVLVPCNDLAMKYDTARSANIAMLGGFVAASGVVSLKAQRDLLTYQFGKKPKVLEAVMNVFNAGVDAALGDKEAVA